MKRTLALVAAIGLLATACGGDDDDATDVTTTVEETATDGTEPSEETVPDTTPTTEASTDDDSAADPTTTEPSTDEMTSDGADAGGDDTTEDATATDDVVQVDSLDDIPQECRDLMAEMLRAMEPIVTDVDWKDATMNDFMAISEEFEDITAGFDQQMDDAGCAEFEFGDDEASYEAIIAFAEDEAPGVVPFMTFLYEFTFGLGDTGGDDDGGDESASEVPADCDGAIAFIRDAVGSADSISDLPMSELMVLTEALTVVSTECSIDRAQEFFEDPTIAGWLEG
jgi:hypothetical protein